MFQTFIKNYQAKNIAINWQQTLQKKEIVKNNYRVTGNIKKAKVFVNNITNYIPHTHFASHREHVIFSSEALYFY